MSRSERLFELLECLRRHRGPVSAAVLAAELSVSVRSIYRDIASLRAQGATIEGEAGIGFILKPGFLLPPLMFDPEELEAVMLGMRWVAKRGDGRLAAASRGALAKILTVLPAQLRDRAEESSLLVGPGRTLAADDPVLPTLRDAIRHERPLHIRYVAGDGSQTERTVWPFGLAFFDEVRVVLAWCELRQAHRHFRTDRLDVVAKGDRRYPRRRALLLAEWRRLEGVPPH